ncbi:MAG: M56 family metallopeptidase, partial [Alistipes sp.]
GNITLSRQSTPLTPFSWMRWIVMSDVDYAENGTTILAHERAHIACGHSIDLLVTDLLSCLQWFNPAMWLLRRELRAIHEYEADAAVLAAGADARAYQLLLIKKAVGGRWYSVANSLNHSNLKNRITMMLRKKSSRWAGAKAFLALPLLCIALGAFAQTTYVSSNDKGREKSATGKIFSGGMSVASEGEGRLFVLVDGKGDALMGAASLTYYNTICDTLQDSTTVILDVPFVHILIAALDDTDAQALGYVKPMILVDGQPLAADATVPDASCITSMMVLDYTQGKAAYGTKGTGGVITIKTKLPDEPSFDFAEALKTRETGEKTNHIGFWGDALQLREINAPKGPTFTMSGSLTSKLISKKESEADLARDKEEMDKIPADWQFVGKIVAHHNEMG